jgi:hypothetical protein
MLLGGSVNRLTRRFGTAVFPASCVFRNRQSYYSEVISVNTRESGTGKRASADRLRLVKDINKRIIAESLIDNLD